MLHKRELQRYIPCFCKHRHTQQKSSDNHTTYHISSYPLSDRNLYVMKFQLEYPTETTTLIVLTGTWFYYVALVNVCFDIQEERAASIFTLNHPKNWGSNPLRNKGRSALHYKVHKPARSQYELKLRLGIENKMEITNVT